jgi:hypothetical protein
MKKLSSHTLMKASTINIILVAVITITFGLFPAQIAAKGKPAKPPNGYTEYTSIIELQDIDSNFTSPSPSGKFRWLDIADQAYGEAYRNAYDYTQATVIVAFAPSGASLRGELTANNLKPNFAYQVKLAGDPIEYQVANEKIGFVGRWWREEWNGVQWVNGRNSSDGEYVSEKDEGDNIGGSPTGLKYKFTGYLVFDYFITDSKGNALLEFEVNSSYHVLWKTVQREPESGDGEIKAATYRVNAKSSPAYDANFNWVTVGVYGEVERAPVGKIYPAPGLYDCQFFLTEESFHGSGGDYAGTWAAAIGAPISFEISE